MRLSGYVKFGLFILLIAVLGIAVHEFIHIVQVSLDDRVKYSHLGVLDGKHIAAVYVNFDESMSSYEKLKWNDEYFLREFEATLVQLIFSVLAVRFVARR